MVPAGRDTDDAETERIDGAFGAVWQALVDSDHPPDGPFWWSVRAAEDADTAELVCRRPVECPVPPDWSIPGWTVESGILPAGVDLVVRWRHGDEVPESGAGAPHPAFIALFIEAEHRGTELNPSRVRQAPLIEDGEPTGYELGVPLGR